MALLINKSHSKLFYFRINSKGYIKEKIGEGAILYALLGYSTETIDLESNFTNNTKLLANIYSENYYLKKNKYVVCYNNKQILDRINTSSIKKHESPLNTFKNQLVNIGVSKFKVTSVSLISSPVKLRTQLSSK